MEELPTVSPHVPAIVTLPVAEPEPLPAYADIAVDTSKIELKTSVANILFINCLPNFKLNKHYSTTTEF